MHLLPRSLAVLLLAALFAPLGSVHAARDLEVSGWIPYWRTTQGVSEARKNIRVFDEVNPFAYSVRTDGSLVDTARLSSRAWDKLEKDAAGRNIRYVPTIMWSDRAAMQTILNDPALRAQHIGHIVAAVKDGGFDGIDIDYEGKSAETREGFSAFLTELRAALKKENSELLLHCTIEARMPLSARYAGAPPATIEYANHLPAINDACDQVRIMSYDQQTADVELQREHYGTPYAPIADVHWVEKVIKYMSEDIDRDKLAIGIATYGHSYQLMSSADGSSFDYTRLGALIPEQAVSLAKKNKITPARNVSGELYFTFVPKDTHRDLPSQAELARYAPRGTASADLAWKGAVAYSKQTGKQVPFRFVTWSDSSAIAQKVALARDMGVDGVAVFSVSGIAERRAWSAFR